MTMYEEMQMFNTHLLVYLLRCRDKCNKFVALTVLLYMAMLLFGALPSKK